MNPLLYVGVLVLSAGLSLGLTPLSILLGRRLNIVSLPGGRRKHQGAMVRIGGLGLYPAFALTMLATLGLAREDPLEITRIVGVLLSMAVVWVVGLADDRYSLPGWAQVAGVVLAAIVAVAFRVHIELFNDPFSDQQVRMAWFLMLPVSVVWLAGMAGTVNLLDGLNGLATGVTGIAAVVLFVHMLRLGQYSVALLPLALLGCCLGFLPYNLRNARIFLGGGAYLLGFGLGAVSIVAGAKVASALLVVWVPILDFAWQMYTRWRRNQPIDLGDRGHLHFRLHDMGWPSERIVILYWAVTALLGAGALLISSRLLKFAVLAVAALAVLGIMALVTRMAGDHTDTGK